MFLLPAWFKGEASMYHRKPEAVPIRIYRHTLIYTVIWFSGGAQLKANWLQKRNRTIQFVYRGLDQFSAILLLTGQITIGGVFIAPGDFALSLSGPFTGSGVEGKDEKTSLVLDALDIITAVLLIIGQINVIGTYITAERFTIVVSGVPFGASKTMAYTPFAREFFSDFRQQVMYKCDG